MSSLHIYFKVTFSLGLWIYSNKQLAMNVFGMQTNPQVILVLVLDSSSHQSMLQKLCVHKELISYLSSNSQSISNQGGCHPNL